MNKPVSISFCCNNPDNGMFLGSFSNVEIGDNLLSLDNKYSPPRSPKLSIEFQSERDGGFGPSAGTGTVTISRRKFPIVGYKYGFGNWCWDVVLVTPEVAIDIINYLQHLGHWTCEGEVRFCDYYERGRPFETRDPKAWWFRHLRKWGYQKP